MLLEYELVVRLAAFGAVLAAMAAWEALTPARPMREPRLRRWRTNIGVALVNAMLLRVAAPATAIGMAQVVAAHGFGLLNSVPVAGWLAIALAVIALDLVLYLQHIALHHVPVLSRLHAVHHADPDFDATTGIRFHPFEMALSLLVKYAAIAALGAPALAVFLFELLLSVSAIFSHGNVRLPKMLDRALRRVIVTPDMHRIHHSTIERERNSNYGFCLAIWDRLFRTYTAAPVLGQRAMHIGLDAFPDARVSTTFSGVLAIPFKA